MARYTQMNHKGRVKSHYRELFSRVVHFEMSQKQYLERRAKIKESNSYKRLTVYNREYIRGMEESLLDSLYNHEFGRKPELIFCYDVDGKRYRIDSKEYKALNPCKVYENHTWHGFCWKTNLDKSW